MDEDEITVEELHKELDLIQGCITRMAQNSFMIKGWGMGIFSILMAMDINKDCGILIDISIFLVMLLFWYLDAFYLRLERQYRKIYEWVIVERPNGNRDKLYDLNIGHYESTKKVQKTTRVMFSKTVWPWYLMPILLCIIKIVYNYI